MARVLSKKELENTQATLGSTLKTFGSGNLRVNALPTNTAQQQGAFSNPQFTAATPGFKKLQAERKGNAFSDAMKSGSPREVLGLAEKPAAFIAETVSSSLYNVAQQMLRADAMGPVATASRNIGRVTGVDVYDTVKDKVLDYAAVKAKEADKVWQNDTYWQDQTAKLQDYDKAPNDLQDWIDTIDGVATIISLGLGAVAKGGVVGAVKGAGIFKEAFFKQQLAAVLKTANKADSAIVNKAFSQLIKTPVPKTPGIGKIAVEKAATNTIKDKSLRAAAYSMLSNRTWKGVEDRIVIQLGGSEAARAIAKDVAIELALRAPMRRENMRFAADIVDAYQNENYFSNGDKIGAIPGTVLAAGFMVLGGPLGALTRNAPTAGKLMKNTLYNENTYFDLVMTGMGVDGQFANGVRRFMETAPQHLRDDAARALRSVQAMNMTRGSAYHAAQQTIQHLKYTHPGKKVWTAEEIIEGMVKYNYLAKQLDAFQGKAKDGTYYILARFDRTTQTKIAQDIKNRIKVATKKAGDKKLTFEQKKALARDYIMEQIEKGAYWAQNKEIVDELLKGIDNAKRSESIFANIEKHISTWPKAKGLPKKLNDEFAANGYVPVAADSRKVVKFRESNIPVRSSTQAAADMYIEQANMAKPIFRSVGGILTKLGLSLDDSAKIAYEDVRAGSVFYIKEALGRDEDFAKKVIRAIEQYTANEKMAHGALGKAARRTVTDARQMTTREIVVAMKDAGIKGITKDEALSIRRAINQANIDLPLRINGLANWLIAKSYRYNPAYKYYSRAQGAFRYTYNPFFKVQENIEAELLGQGAVQGKTPWIMGMGHVMPGKAKELDDIARRMEEIGMFRTQGASGFASYGAEDAFIGRINTVLTQTQKRNVATTVQRMANSMNMSVDDLLLRHPQDVMDIVRPIIQYPTKGVINSSLAKALNVAIFPARYNMKVTGLAVSYLSKQPPAVQVLTINKLWEFQNWLKSDEGLLWQQENRAAIQFIKWLTPLGSVQWVLDVLNKPFGQDSEIQSVGDLGSLGGLPFGVITQILDSQGIININAPYVNPEDGEIYAKYIPESMKARVASAVTDLLGSTFSYPGRTVGLPGKGQALREAAAMIGLDPKKEEWTYVHRTDDDLNNLGKRKVELWQQAYLEAFGVNPPVNTKAAQGQYQGIIANDVIQYERKPYLNKSQLRELINAQKAAKKAKKEAEKAAKAAKTSPTKVINNQTVKVKPSAVSGPFAGQ